MHIKIDMKNYISLYQYRMTFMERLKMAWADYGRIQILHARSLYSFDSHIFGLKKYP
jgi:hypothetical protein